MTIVVSGGSRGLGLSIVRRCLAGGHAIATFARNETPAMQELSRSHGDRFYFRPMDARSTDEFDRFLAESSERLGEVDAIVNNAAIGQDHLLTHIPLETLADILEVNLRGPIIFTRAFVRRLLVTGRTGRIVNITSICATRGYAGLTVYSATKGAMEAFTRSLAREVGSRGILVNAIAPGFFLSEMSSVLAPHQIDSIRRRTPTGALVTNEDVLPIVETLLFGEANITGQVFCVDGGLSA